MSAQTDKEDSLAPAHDALFYSSDDDLLRFVVPFLREGISRKESAVVVAKSPTRQLLEPVLHDIGPVEFVSPAAVFRRTVTAVHAYQRLVERALAGGAQRVRAVSEVDFGTTPQARAESVRFEAVANVALADQPLWNVCLYDVRKAPADLLRSSSHAHPFLVTDERRRSNPEYVAPVELLRRHSQSGPYREESRAPDVQTDDLRALGLSSLRRTVRTAAWSGSVLGQAQIDDFLEAITEVASNSLVHGKGPVSFRGWVARQRIICTITDRGRGFDDPLAGFLPHATHGLPAPRSGLWLARNFSDSLDFSTTAEGFTARLACWTN